MNKFRQPRLDKKKSCLKWLNKRNSITWEQNVLQLKKVKLASKLTSKAMQIDPEVWKRKMFFKTRTYNSRESWNNKWVER